MTKRGAAAYLKTLLEKLEAKKKPTQQERRWANAIRFALDELGGFKIYTR